MMAKKCEKRIIKSRACVPLRGGVVSSGEIIVEVTREGKKERAEKRRRTEMERENVSQAT